MDKRIPIRLGDFSVIDTEFNSIRERFDQEMRKMEDEMGKFRSELMTRESPVFSRGMPSVANSNSSQQYHMTEARKWIDGIEAESQRSSSSDAFSSAFSSNNAASSSELAPPPSSWLEGLSSPLIQEDGEQKLLKLRFDVSQYTPEEIVVKTVDNKLLVHAKHEEKSENRTVFREYNREFLLPKGTNPELIKSSLSRDGVLTVEAPMPALPAGEKLIPIGHQ
ncbi:alpha-crystallin B chain-like isoform X2 [Artemia franciscana]|uniref:alpha-crystallin B chain-like isoform X2 n=1 Tax=Artemia franciscana TaxID=6661 RepID=UPI0032DBAA80